MDIIKKQYTRPRPMLYLYRDKPEVSLVSNDFNTAKNITLNQQMNEVSTLSFEIPFTKERKLSVDDCEKLVKFEGEFYIIKTIDTEDSTTATMKVTCQHESTELKGVYCEYIDLIGATPKQMFDKIMGSTLHPVDTGYNWAGTDVEPTKKRHLITESEQSVYQNLVAMAEIFNGWLEFWTDENGKRWIYLRTKSIDSHKWIKKGLDMQSLNISYSSEEIFTRLYPLGDTDKLTGEPLNIMEVNPTKKSYIENYSYYLAKGIPTSVIDKEPKYQQLKTMTCSDYTDAKDLYEYALEELEKCCYPILDATLSMEDLSVYVDSLDEPPKVGYDIKCIDKEIEFILGCRITGVERNYDNPLDTKITISNLVRYDTFFQKLEHSSDTTDKIVSSDKDGNYIDASKVKDGDHINIAYTLGDHTTKITENGNRIQLLAKDVAGNRAEINVQAGKISTLVKDVAGNKSAIEQNAKGITTLVKDVNGNKTQIKQLSNKIESKVDEDDFGSLIQQNARSVKIAWNKISKYATIDDEEGLILGDEGSGSYSKIGYNGRLECYIAGSSRPYHCLSYGFVRYYSTSRTSNGYTRFSERLPSYFKEVPYEHITCIATIRKIYDTDCDDTNNVPFWFGVYASVDSNYRIRVDVMSIWKKVYYDENDDSSWVEDIDGTRYGNIDIGFSVFA